MYVSGAFFTLSQCVYCIEISYYLTLSRAQGHRGRVEKIGSSISIVTKEERHLSCYFPNVADGQLLHILRMVAFLVALSVSADVQWSKHVPLVR